MRNKKKENWFSDFLGKSTRHLFPPKAPPTLFQDDQPVHQLWPPEDVVQSTNCDVVLFHGTQRPGETQPWKTTWVTRNDPHDCWVQTWLPQDLSEVNVRVRVLALSYDSCAMQYGNRGNTDDVSEIAKKSCKFLFPGLFCSMWTLIEIKKSTLVMYEGGVSASPFDHTKLPQIKIIYCRVCCKGASYIACI
jgi:hypothetical protein